MGRDSVTYCPLNTLEATDLMMMPSPIGNGKPLLCFVLYDPKKCNWTVPYVFLEGSVRGKVYHISINTSVKKVEENSYRIPPIPLLLFHYGELEYKGPKEALENTTKEATPKNKDVEVQSLREYQLSLFECQQ